MSYRTVATNHDDARAEGRGSEESRPDRHHGLRSWSHVRRILGAIATAVVTLGLLAAVLPAMASATTYVAMGDSYASGTGTREYYEGCERSMHAYPHLIKNAFGGSFAFTACGGARTQDVISNQLGPLNAGTEYATVSIGGNDAGFSSVITRCALPLVSCNPQLDQAQAFIQNTLPAQLDAVYSAIRNRAPNAIVGVVGYPRLFNGTDCNAGTFFSGAEMTRLNQTADILANVTRARAQAHGFTFIDSRGAFTGHAVCDNPEWLNGLANPTSESYHPNRLAHSQGYAPIIREGLLAAPSPNDATGPNGRIAFQSNRTGNNEIFVMNRGGGFPVNLTEHPASDIDPAWSPDGTKIAFASNRDGDNEIYVMNSDGSGLTKLTHNTANDRDPAWSPNGSRIAFRSDRTGNNEIFTMSAMGSGQTNLTNHPASDFAPDWSPNGADIVFQRFTSGSGTGFGNEVMKMNADGQGQTNLTANASSINDGQPVWHPNGNTIAFHSNRTGNFEIFTMSWAGASVNQRTNDPASDQQPAYAPTGTQIAFNTNRDGNNEIYTMTSTGGSQTNRTNMAGNDIAASWQADSTPPVTTVDSGPDELTNDPTPTFEFSSSELGSTFQCSVDGAPFANCSSPFTTSSLSDGPHTFAVRATDEAGNTDPTPASLEFTVDATAPELALSCPQSVLLNGNAVAVASASDHLSGLAPGADPSGEYQLDASRPGAHTFGVQATDLAGNTTSEECEYQVRYRYGGLRKPLKDDGLNTVKLGSTVPVKFDLGDASGEEIDDAVAELRIAKVDGGKDGAYRDATSTSAASDSNRFRYSEDESQYVFNLATKPLDKGTHRLKVVLDDDSVHKVLIELR